VLRSLNGSGAVGRVGGYHSTEDAQFVADSALEESGFEPAVPHAKECLIPPPKHRSRDLEGDVAVPRAPAVGIPQPAIRATRSSIPRRSELAPSFRQAKWPGASVTSPI